MNTPLSSPNDIRCAEYVLGVLDGTERRRIEQAMHLDPQLAASVLRWQNHLMPLNDDIVAIEPAPHVWKRIQSDLGFVLATPSRPRISFWNNLSGWRWIGIGSSVAALALAVLAVLPVREQTAAGPGQDAYKVASLVRNGGGAGWTVTVDVERARMVIVPSSDTPVAADRSTELWLITPDGRPASLGLIAADRPTVVPLPRAALLSLNARAVLAVSLEPHGGSPTGQPTGPVLAQGAVGGA
ncbi:anti-sigma factor [Burkholderia cepacia]|uniref:anti-sigma factor n=1 Tax=Burkholderia cepacia TaxID=292 RepID=UPI00249D9164|nr:anti-sigma factor [Burkholderia cepacia]WGY70496.1 anti-sigma factor [Burkholderia cepacia]